MIPLGLYGAARPMVPGGGITYIGNVVTDGNATTISVPIGDAHADRIVFFALSYATPLVRNLWISLVNGVAVTSDAISAWRGTVQIFHASIPAGTSATLTTDTSTARTARAVHVHAWTYIGPVTPLSSADTNPVDLTPADLVIIAANAPTNMVTAVDGAETAPGITLPTNMVAAVAQPGAAITITRGGLDGNGDMQVAASYSLGA